MPDTLHTVWAAGGLLGIACLGCDHRAVGVAELPGIALRQPELGREK
jgi:hypothetical protein